MNYKKKCITKNSIKNRLYSLQEKELFNSFHKKKSSPGEKTLKIFIWLSLGGTVGGRLFPYPDVSVADRFAFIAVCL